MHKQNGATLVVAVVICASTWCVRAQQTPTPSNPKPDRTSQQRILRSSGPDTPLLLLAGEVVLEDGLPPPEPLLIELLCSGQVSQQVYSNRLGHFRFRLGGPPSSEVADPSVSGQNVSRLGLGGDPVDPAGGSYGYNVGPGQGYFGRFDLNGCEIRAAATLGFASNVIKLGTHGSMDYSKVGVILLRRSEGWQGTTISLQTLRAPEKARKAYEAALKELRREKPRLSRAAQELEKAVEAFPDFAAAWTLLGQSRLQLHEPGRARQAWVKAIEADPGYVKPYLSLGLLELNEERWEEAVKLALKVRDLGPELPQAYYILGLARYYEGRLAEAEQELQFLVENGHSRQFPIALLHLGIIHTSQGNVRQAVSEFHSYFEHTPRAQIPDWHLNRVQEQLNQWLAQGLILPEDAILSGQPEND